MREAHTFLIDGRCRPSRLTRENRAFKWNVSSIGGDSTNVCEIQGRLRHGLVDAVNAYHQHQQRNT